MTERSRPRLLAWSSVFLGLFAVLGVLVTRDRSPLEELDELGRQAATWALGHTGLAQVMLWVETAFSSIPMTVVDVLLVLALLLRRQHRAAAYAAVVTLGTALVTTAVKVTAGRARPDWQDPTGTLSSMSFPSAHSSSVAALATVLVVLSRVFLRRASLRRAVLVGATLLWVLVALDRVLLGRHYPTDVIGGALLAVGIGLLTLALIDPEPRGHAGKIEPLPEVIASERRLAVVLNPSKVDDVGQFRALVSSMAAESGWSEPRWHFTTVDDPGTGMAEAAAIDGADLVLVCGGDGTVREVCAELAGTGIPVGIVPAGTGNLLARNLDVPLYLRSAIDVALNGQDRAIDLVRVEGDGIEGDTHFLVMAGMGLDAAIMEGVNEGIKEKVGWFAYVISALKALMFPAVRIDISVDGGEPTATRARTVVVGNVGFLQAGMPLLPDAAIDDGQLDVVVLHPKRFLSWVPLALRVLARRPRTDETINRMTGQTVVLRAHADTPRQLDGDAIGPGRELRMECLHGRLLVRVPR